MSNENERSRLEKIAKWFTTQGDYTSILVKYAYQTIEPFFKGANCLELGCGNGLMTTHLVNVFNQVIAVDGSKKFCEIVTNRIKVDNLKVICSTFESVEFNEKFDTILMAHILEHVDQPIELLKKASNWLKEDGVILLCVPNSNSIHRQLGLKMGLLSRLDELNETDIKLGHRRVYNWELLKKHINASGLKIKQTGGIFFKPLTNSQMMEWFDEKLMDGFYELGKDFPDISVLIYTICQI